MKRFVLLTALALVLAVPGISWGQGMPGGGVPPSGGMQGGGMQGGGMAPGGMQGGGMMQPGNGQDFQTRKADILKHLNERLAEVQQRIGCVQAAADHQALRACMPQRGEGHGGEH